jgi:hypothetical protein
MVSEIQVLTSLDRNRVDNKARVASNPSDIAGTVASMTEGDPRVASERTSHGALLKAHYSLATHINIQTSFRISVHFDVDYLVGIGTDSQCR